jgi:probable addiction module antidote protein
MPTIDYKDHLLEELKDPEYAAGYLTAALEEGDDVFLLAVRDVAQARGGMATLAKAIRLSREGLRDILSERGNPRLSNITAILNRMGFGISVTPKARRRRVA